MASKRKSKPKRHEMDFESKRIDARRFAYDVIKYSALKFGVPESCINIWNGADNDYGCCDLCLSLFRSTIKYQIQLRCTFHAHFNQRYESNKFESYELIRRLFQEVINKYTMNPLRDIEDVKMSLSVACELVLFLYSKKLNLHLQELAENWFDCYLLLVKKSFEKAGGLKELYLKSKSSEKCFENAFNDKFISVYCLPYEDSVKIRNLDKLYPQIYDKYIKKIGEYFIQIKYKETDDISVLESSSKGCNTEFETAMLPVTKNRNEASGIDIPQNSDMGRTTFEEFLRSDSLTLTLFINTALSQIFPEANLQNQPQHS